MSTDPCGAARDILDAARRVVPSAQGARLGLLRQRETVHLVEACRKGGVALSVEPLERTDDLLERALVQREIVCVPDGAVTSYSEVAALIEESARSFLLAPLSTDTLTLGLLALWADQPGVFSSQDAERLELVASEGAAVMSYWARLLRAEAVCQYDDAIIEGLEEGLVVLDASGQIIRANRRLGELAAFAPEEMTFPCPVDGSACPPTLLAIVQPSGGTVIGPYEVILDGPAGERRTLGVFPSPLADPSLGEMRIVRDTSEERDAAQGRALFISQIAHELRGPLQHIMGFTGLIRDFDDLPRDSYERFFGHIKDETDHLARLVDDLVEYSRIEMGRFTVLAEPTQLDALVADVIERMRPRCQLRGLDLSLEETPYPLWAYADPLRISQVIGNLVENALKFVPSGGSIVVAVRPDGDHHVLVSVSDSGPGIPPEAMDRLFDRFYQVRTGTNVTGPGMGLGLYTCREIVRAHGGEIWAESEYGKGSTFYFRLNRVTPYAGVLRRTHRNQGA